jgi:hypothetical protein
VSISADQDKEPVPSFLDQSIDVTGYSFNCIRNERADNYATIYQLLDCALSMTATLRLQP